MQQCRKPPSSSLISRMTCDSSSKYNPCNTLKAYPDRIQLNPNFANSLSSILLPLNPAAISARLIFGHPRDLRDFSLLVLVNLSYPSCNSLFINLLPLPHFNVLVLRPRLPAFLFSREFSIASVISLFSSCSSATTFSAPCNASPPHYTSFTPKSFLCLLLVPLIVICPDLIFVLIVDSVPSHYS